MKVQDLTCPLVSSDTPKILGVVTAYTWEGNAANISCEVEAHPPASVLWFRDGLQLPPTNTSNLRIHSSSALSLLEVSSSTSSWGCHQTSTWPSPLSSTPPPPPGEA